MNLKRKKRIVRARITPLLSERYCAFTIFPILRLGVLNVSSGVVFALTSSTLAIWLKESGTSLAYIGLLSFLYLPHALKFLWAPWFDRFSLSWLSHSLRCSSHEAWILIFQVVTLISLLGMATTSPLGTPWIFSLYLLLLTLASASYNTLIQAAQAITVPQRFWGMGEAAAVFGFRMGLLLATAGALYLSTYLSWSQVYLWLSLSLCAILLFTLLTTKLRTTATPEMPPPRRLSSWRHTVLLPFRDFMRQPRWGLVLLFMLLYRLQDNFIGVLPSVFYLDTGYSKIAIATVDKTLGMWVTIIGGFIGGYLMRQRRYVPMLVFGIVLHSLASTLFVVLCHVGVDMMWFYLTVIVEKFARGLDMAAFFTFQMVFCRRRFVVTQLALITSVATIGQVLAGAVSGAAAAAMGWEKFFTLAVFLGIPGLVVLRYLPFRSPAGRSL